MAAASLYGGAQFRDRHVTSGSNRFSSRLIAVGLLAAALALAGCGRKGGLDLPPGATGQPGAAAAVPPEDASGIPPQRNVFDSGASDKGPVAARGAKKRIILDPLLD